MEVLLSLPIVSYFFSTSMSSYSTSLNLLFFYLTWTTLVLSHSPLKIEVMSTTAIRILFWLVPSLFFLIFDTLLPSLSENLKYDGSSALPPRDARSLAGLLALAIGNLALTTGTEAAMSLGLATLIKEPPFRTSTTLPLPWQMVKHIALLFAAREALSFYIHRNVLHPSSSARQGTSALTRVPHQLRDRAATQHARFAHAHRAAPFSLLAMADHPLPQLLLHLLPIYLLPSISGTAGGLPSQPRLHVLTYLVFVALATLEETLAYSGYAALPGVAAGGLARRAAAHRAGGGEGNYGPWGFLDWAYGTGLGGGRDGDDAAGLVQSGVEGLRRSGEGEGEEE
ncbi:sterol desaturase [Phialemonium atrogriseum]|uniref:Sterol desaturase n=1 Tax=Phialemonium atrogriseum TaxID=1093897 RepID=A0AAJ0C3H5_9PEZI|nr:sterol desaturase [Phialemonium atrogriseum]KAK1768049.1 sterol desaturase [Phialemonium atrogriseum]